MDDSFHHSMSSQDQPGLPMSPKPQDSTVSIKVSRKALHAVIDNGLNKSLWFEKYVPIHLRNRVVVEAAEYGTSDSVFFAPEYPNVNFSNQRVVPVEYIKVSPSESSDVVHQDDDFEVSFVGMSVSSKDNETNNGLLLSSLTKEDVSVLNIQKQAQQPSTQKRASAFPVRETNSPYRNNDLYQNMSSYPLQFTESDLHDFPIGFNVSPGDYPYIHFDPQVDGHGAANQSDTFLPVPGSKRLYVQRKSVLNDLYGDVNMRFSVMEMSRLISSKKGNEMAKGMGKPGPMPNLFSRFIKFSNVAGTNDVDDPQPIHVLSTDLSFMLAPKRNPDAESATSDGTTITNREQYGNYLRYGYYFFLSSPVDAKLYAQTGASSQNLQLLMRRQDYESRRALPNEKEFFPLAGVSYVVVKVTRGNSLINADQRKEILRSHRSRLVKLLRVNTNPIVEEYEE